MQRRRQEGRNESCPYEGKMRERHGSEDPPLQRQMQEGTMYRAPTKEKTGRNKIEKQKAEGALRVGWGSS